jgi:hypothetical protein
VRLFKGWLTDNHKKFIRTVIPAKAGIWQKNFPRSGQNPNFVPLRGDYSINWIPSFAGMPMFWLIDYLK